MAKAPAPQNTPKQQLSSTIARKKRVAQALKVNLQRRKAAALGGAGQLAIAPDEEQLPKQ